MNDRKGEGQREVIRQQYKRLGPKPVAYVDETYHAEPDGRAKFYVMAAVVVLHRDIEPLRRELDSLVPDGYWHSTSALRTRGGREQFRDLLRSFQSPEETCVIVQHSPIEPGDKGGRAARAAVLAKLLQTINAEAGLHPPVQLAVLEEHRVAQINNADRAVLRELIANRRLDSAMSLTSISPAAEHLLWLPDLVCSAYRQQITRNDASLYNEISALTRVIHIP